MRLFEQYGPRLAALLVAAAVLVQVFCPGGSFAGEVAGNYSASQGCHGSPPHSPHAPAPQQRCCAVTPVAKPSPVARDVAPPALVAGEAGVVESPRLTSMPTASFPLALMPASPGLLVLRI